MLAKVIFAPATSLANRFSVHRFLPPTPHTCLYLYSALLVGAILAFTIRYFVSESLFVLGYVLDIASCITCGIFWLFSRELFRLKNSPTTWPPILIVNFFIFSVILYVADHLGATREGFFGFLASVNLLIGSTVLLLPLFEALDGISRQVGKNERLFRFFFVSGYGLLVGISLIVALPKLEEWESGTQVILSWIALIGVILSVWHRSNNPLALASERKRHNLSALVVDPSLRVKILEALEAERIFLNPQTKVADLAALIGQPDYKVTQCITMDLEYRNFNQMMNTYRIQEAIRQFSEQEFDPCSILSIAMNSGFGSIGPFNRAFKDQTGMTPGEYRNSLAEKR